MRVSKHGTSGDMPAVRFDSPRRGHRDTSTMAPAVAPTVAPRKSVSANSGAAEVRAPMRSAVAPLGRERPPHFGRSLTPPRRGSLPTEKCIVPAGHCRRVAEGVDARLIRMSTDDVLVEALRLSRRDRVRVAEELLSSLEEPEDEVAAAWAGELERRSRDVSEGRAQTTDWATARAEILSELEQRRARRTAS